MDASAMTPEPTTVTATHDSSREQWTLTIAAPGWLTMNSRLHWRATAGLTTDWRDRTALTARQAHLPVGQVTRARFDAELRFTRTVRRDPANWHPTLKVIIDALTAGTRTHPGYGFLPDDAPRYLHCQDCPHLSIGARLKPRAFGPLGQVVLTITDLSAS